MLRLGTKESAAKHALDFQEKLEPFLSWLEEFRQEETAPIGLKHSDIERLLHDMQVGYLEAVLMKFSYTGFFFLFA